MAAYYVIPFYKMSKSSESKETESRVLVCRNWGKGRGRVFGLTNWYRVSFLGNGNILELDNVLKLEMF